MPIYEYRCRDCGTISEFLFMKTDDPLIPQCRRCKSKKLSRILSRVRVLRSEESRLENLGDPSQWGGLDENDPKSMARWMKKMGRELGEDMGEMDEMVEAAMEEEAGSKEGEPAENSED